MFTLLASGIFSLIGTIFGKIFSVIERRLEAQIKEREALLEQAGLKVRDNERAQKLEANFTRRLVMISFTLLFVGIIMYSVVNPLASVVIPVVQDDTSFWSLIFSFGSGAKISYIELPLSVIMVPFIDLFALMVGFYFGSGGSLRSWR